MPKPRAKDGLTPLQARFVDEYLIDLNAAQAAIRAGYSEKNAAKIGPETLGKTSVQAAIQRRQKDLARRTEITQEKVLERWWKLATADPNELMQHRRECCRHCYGRDHAYQWRDEQEFFDALADAQRQQEDVIKKREMSGREIPDVVMPTNEGGYGFDSTLTPHAKCPACDGVGYGRAHFEDTRHLSEGARLLYAGVKQTKEGMEIKVHDQAKALENVARHLGMFNDKIRLGGDPENPLLMFLKNIQGASVPVNSNHNEDDDAEGE